MAVTSSFKETGKYQKGRVVFAMLGLFTIFALGSIKNEPFESTEVRFTDASQKGFQIVPASCPSNPHYAGECTTPNGDIPGGGGTPPQPATGCVLYANPSVVAYGRSSSLSWNTGCGSGGCSNTPGQPGTIIPGVGSVTLSGTRSVSPAESTTYVYSGSYAGSSNPATYSCSRSVMVCAQGQYVYGGNCVSQCPTGYTPNGEGQCIGTCPTGYVLVGGSCVANSCRGYYCSGDDLYYEYQSGAQCVSDKIQTCGYGCGGAACLPPPAATLNISTKPGIVQRGNTVLVEWSSANTNSCTVRGENGDQWSGVVGAQTSGPIPHQTKYTLTCIGKNGITYSKWAIVSIIPVYEEVQCPAGFHEVNNVCVAN